MVTTFAGGGPGTATNGTGTAASFNLPMDVAVDAAGNAYVTDAANQLIRKISPAGVVTTLAGGNANNMADGQGSAAGFSGPEGIAVDASGNLYVADYPNNTIRKITPGGLVSTLAGNGTRSSVDGTGSAASFNGPHSVAVDAAGNVYVSDYLSGDIRKITPAGVVTTLAGNGTWGYADGTGSAALFRGPYGIAIGPDGNIYVVDQENQMIRKVTPQGVVTTIAGDPAHGGVILNGNGRAAAFNDPAGIAIDSKGNLYIGDLANFVVRKIDNQGNVTTYAGTGAQGAQNGPASTATFNEPVGVAVDANGTVYVADAINYLIRKIAVN